MVIAPDLVRVCLYHAASQSFMKTTSLDSATLARQQSRNKLLPPIAGAGLGKLTTVGEH